VRNNLSVSVVEAEVDVVGVILWNVRMDEDVVVVVVDVAMTVVVDVMNEMKKTKRETRNTERMVVGEVKILKLMTEKSNLRQAVNNIRRV
jgi:hypothetical protein